MRTDITRNDQTTKIIDMIKEKYNILKSYELDCYFKHVVYDSMCDDSLIVVSIPSVRIESSISRESLLSIYYATGLNSDQCAIETLGYELVQKLKPSMLEFWRGLILK